MFFALIFIGSDMYLSVLYIVFFMEHKRRERHNEEARLISITIVLLGCNIKQKSDTEVTEITT